jgi:cytochrome c nitrite reductase small subunit
MRLPLITGIVALAAVLGVGLYVSDFTVYLGDDPTACNNCHVMDAAYEGWYHAGHKAWAACNDCHTPHAFIPKYIVKGLNGYNHVSAFTLGHIPNAIRATDRQRDIVQENCIRCHAETVSDVGDGQKDGGRFCFECHRSVAHGERGVSILPYQDKGERSE